MSGIQVDNNVPLITVIVPVYNKVNYVTRCIDSILAQSYKNLQVILVDDGSTDGSSDICDEYAAKDSRVEVVHKKNGGLSSARNCGIRIAKGEYVGFVDADDYIDVEMYQTLYDAVKNNNVKLGVCGILHLVDNEIRKATGDWEKEEVFSSEEAVVLLLRGKAIDFSVCNKLHHRSLLNNDAFPEGALCEDVVFTGAELLKAGSIVHVGCNMYYYFHTEGSITQNHNVAYIKAHIKQRIKLHDEMLSYWGGTADNTKKSLVADSYERPFNYAVFMACGSSDPDIYKLLPLFIKMGTRIIKLRKRAIRNILPVYKRLFKIAIEKKLNDIRSKRKRLWIFAKRILKTRKKNG